MNHASAFSPDYIAARARFRSAALALGWGLEEHPIGQKGAEGEDLTIELAYVGDLAPKRLVVLSSGLHGVEGFFGSAVQAFLMEEQLGGWRPPKGSALLLIHALNPYGFSWTRRVNEDNADLNRNFLLPGEAFKGSPEDYATFDPLFNPERPPLPVSTFKVRAAYNILKYGMKALKNTLPVGQYDFPKGLFYGGSTASMTQKILAEQLPRFLSSAEHVLHVDYHTGVGTWGSYKLFTNCPMEDPRAAYMAGVFGERNVEAWDPDSTSYIIRGGMGTWLREHFSTCTYDQITAEFGTFNVISVVEALRSENMAHHWGRPDDPATLRAKKGLRETFAPGDIEWRAEVVETGLEIAQRAIEACLGE